MAICDSWPHVFNHLIKAEEAKEVKEKKASPRTGSAVRDDLVRSCAVGPVNLRP